MSTIKVDTIQDTSGNEQFTAKAWVNFNGTGTVAIRADGNVSSLTDYAVGVYGINYSSALADASYAPSGQTQAINAADQGTVTLDATSATAAPTLMTTTAYRFRTCIARVGNYDMANINVTILR